MAVDQATIEREAGSRADFDEQLWPVNVLLLVLAAVVAGLIVARADFHTPNLWANGYVHLAILGAIVALLALAATVLRRGHQRRMQLAVLASLLLHLWVSLGMHEYRLPQVASPHPRAARDRELVRVPDYHFHQLERPSEKQFFERPVEADPAPAIADVEPPRKQPTPRPIVSPRPAKTDPLEPRPIELKRAESSAPHRGERLTGPQKAASDTIARLEPAAVPRQRAKPAANQQPLDTAEPPAVRSRAPAEVEPRVAMHSQPRASQSRDLQALARAASIERPAIEPVPGSSAPPAMEPLARSTSTALPDEHVPVGPTPQTSAAALADDLAPAAQAMGRRSTPAATALEPPAGLPLAPPGFDGPTMPVGSRIAGPEAASETPGAEQPTPRPLARSQRDVPLAGEGPVAIASGRSATATTQAGTPGELEPSIAPRSRSHVVLPDSSSMASVGAGNGPEALSAGHAPGAPSSRLASMPDAPDGNGIGGPGPVGSLQKHRADVPVDSTAAVGAAASRGGGTAAKAAEPAAGPIEPLRGRMSGPTALPLRSGAPAVAAAAGPPTLEPGMPSSRARPESNLLASETPRLILERSGGELAIDARVRDTAVPGFKQRDRAGRSGVAQQRGGSVQTELAVERGLEFLARFQSPDGSWRLHNDTPGFDYPVREITQIHSTTAATGLALLAFLGAGDTHTDGPHRALVQRGLNWLLAHQRSNGDLYQPQDRFSNSSAWLYSHGIASIALCEAYGMTRDRRLREPAQRALDFIVSAQNADEGGWRYSPGAGSDTSVSGWQLMALKSGELAGLKVPRECYARIGLWLDHAQGADGQASRYAYMPDSDLPAYRAASTVMTAESLLMRQYLGWRRNHPEMVAGARWLEQNLPQFGTPSDERPTGERNAYYWYYGTQVMFQMQGRYWQAWNGRLRPLLTESQTTEGPLSGSWDPVKPVPDRYGYMVGRLYVTALHLLVLEVYYRHLPIYQTLEVPSR